MALPGFPSFDSIPQTEDGFEILVERLCDRADAVFMAGKCTTADYEAWMIRLSDWSSDALASLPN